MGRLSVVIPSATRPEHLERCLRSVTNFAPASTEILVVDDASQEACVSAVACRFPGVRVLRLMERRGFCTAANVGILSTDSDVVELLNDDTEVSPGWADAALQQFDNPSVVAVAPLVLQLDRTRQRAGLTPLIDSAGDDYDYGGFARKRFHNAELDAQRTRLAVAQPVWGASASAAFYRRETVVAAGLFPADFGAYFEDVDLAHRLRARGQVIFEPASVVWHRVSASYGREPSAALLEQQSRNEERVFWRNVRGWSLIAHLPRHIAVLTGKAARRLQEHQFTPWWRGRWQAWTGR